MEESLQLNSPKQNSQHGEGDTIQLNKQQVAYKELLDTWQSQIDEQIQIHTEYAQKASKELQNINDIIHTLKSQKEIYNNEYERVLGQIIQLETVQVNNPLNFDQRYASLQKQAKLQEEILLIEDDFENEVAEFDSKIEKFQDGVNEFLQSLLSEFNG